MKKPKPVYYTMIKHSGHLRILEKCRKHSPAARVFYISLVFSNARRVLSQCNTQLRLLYLSYKKSNIHFTIKSYKVICMIGFSTNNSYRLSKCETGLFKKE